MYILTVIVIFVLLQDAEFNLQIDGTFDLLNPSNIVVEFEVFDDFTMVIVNELLWIWVFWFIFECFAIAFWTLCLIFSDLLIVSTVLILKKNYKWTFMKICEVIGCNLWSLSYALFFYIYFLYIYLQKQIFRSMELNFKFTRIKVCRNWDIHSVNNVFYLRNAFPMKDSYFTNKYFYN